MMMRSPRDERRGVLKSTEDGWFPTEEGSTVAGVAKRGKVATTIGKPRKTSKALILALLLFVLTT